MNTLVLEKEPVAVDIQLTDQRLIVELEDGRSISIPVEWYPRLSHATKEERTHWELLGGGYAIEWPDLDEHIGIEGLLAGRKSGESEVSFQKWLASRRQE